VNRLGLRLALAGGRGAVVGLALTALAVAIGTAILLFALSFRPALDDRADRSAWRSSIVLSDSGTADDAAFLMTTALDSYQGEPLVRVMVAVLADDAPLPPGLDRWPGPGQAAVSPALAARIAAVPADELGDRIGTVVGTIGDAGLRSPQELVAVIGVTEADISALGASPVKAFDPRQPTREIPPIAVLMIALAIVGALVPVAVFVSTATRLSAARREQRLAALRLVGATSVQVSRLALVEAVVVTVLGAVAGIGVFLLARPLVAMVPLDEATWFPDSIVPPLVPAVVLLLAIPIVGAAAAMLALRRVIVTPLGVQRRQTPPTPGILRAVPLAVSLAGLVAAMAILGRGASSDIVSLALVGLAFGGVIVGIVLIGPWLTVLVGRGLHRLPLGASTLLASRRLTDDPRSSFGSIAGVIMAVFVASAFFTFVAYADEQSFDRAGVLHAGQVYVQMPFNEGPVFAEVPGQIGAVPGVRAVLPIPSGELFLDGSPVGAWVVSCADLTRQFDLPARLCGTAPIHVLGLGTALTAASYDFIADRGDRSPISLTVRASDVATLEIGISPVVTDIVTRNVRVQLPQVILDPSLFAAAGRQPSANTFYIDTDGSTATAERVRTTVLASVATAYVRLASEDRETSHVYQEFGRVVGLGLIGSLVLAGCSLAVAVTTGVLERRRQFALLRSAGMPVSRLRALVLLQAGAPLVVVALVSAALGIVVAQVVLRLADAPTVPWPNGSLVVTLAVSLAGAMAVVVLMLPPLERLTRPDAIRIE
jgi:FtsX-like permease family protein